MGFFVKLFNDIRSTSSTDLIVVGEEDVFSLTIPKDDIESSTQRIADLVSNNFTSRGTAIQFVLEELDVAQNGNTRERMFVVNSGVEHNLYNDSITNFDQEKQRQIRGS